MCNACECLEIGEIRGEMEILVWSDDNVLDQCWRYTLDVYEIWVDWSTLRYPEVINLRASS